MKYIGLDGVSYRVVENTDLAIKMSHRLIVLDSGFPTETNPALANIFGYPLAGYEPEAFFDKRSGRTIRTGPIKQLLNLDDQYFGFYFGYHGNVLLYTLSYFLTGLAVEFDLRKLKSNNYFRFFSGVCDAVGHMFGDDGMAKMVKWVDEAVLDLDLGANDITLFSDHGMTKDNGKRLRRLNLEEILENAGYGIARKVNKEKWDREVVCDCVGMLNVVPVYCNPKHKNKISDVLIRSKGVELVLKNNGESIEVAGKSGKGMLFKEGDMWRYDTKGEDPLGYGDARISDEESYEEFCDYQYPDAFRRIWKAFELKNAAEIIAVLNNRFYYGSRLLRLACGERFIATHGSLERECSEAFLLVPKEKKLKTVWKKEKEYMRISNLRLD